MSRGLLLLLLSVRVAAASPGERSDGFRALQMAPVLGGGAMYLALEFGLKEAITPAKCRWCNSNAFDTAARNALRWDNVKLANWLSNITGYYSAPVVSTGVLLLGSRDDFSFRRGFDDSVVVLQAGILTGMLNQSFKIIAGRRRPFAHFGSEAVRPANDINTSFFSGHTALAFAMATSAGTVAHIREYDTEAAIWISGLTLATVTGYLRIAGDAHYTTDVIAGALVGAAVGVILPMTIHKRTLTDEPGDPPEMRVAPPVMFSIGSPF